MELLGVPCTIHAISNLQAMPECYPPILSLVKTALLLKEQTFKNLRECYLESKAVEVMSFRFFFMPFVCVQVL